MLFVQDATTASKALERWPELLLAAAVSIPLVWALVKLFKMHNDYRNANETRRDTEMTRIIDAHEKLGSALVKAVESASERSDANFKEMARRFRGRGPEAKE